MWNDRRGHESSAETSGNAFGPGSQFVENVCVAGNSSKSNIGAAAPEDEKAPPAHVR